MVLDIMETKGTTLKDLIEEAKEKENPELNPTDKKVYSFRLTNETMDKIEFYTEKEKVAIF